MAAADILDSFDGLSEVTDDVAATLSSSAAWLQHLPTFKPHTLVRTALGAASVNPPELVLLAEVCNAALAKGLGEFEPGDLVTFAWAVAAASQQGDIDQQRSDLLVAVGGQVAERAWEFNADELSKIVRAFASVRRLHEGMMTAVSMETMWKIDQFSAHSLSEITESFALLDFCKEHTFASIASRVIARLQDFQPDELASIMWSFAKASIKHETLATEVAKEVTRSARTMTDEDFYRISWAFSKLGVPARGALQPLYHPHLKFGLPVQADQ